MPITAGCSDKVLHTQKYKYKIINAYLFTFSNPVLRIQATKRMFLVKQNVCCVCFFLLQLQVKDATQLNPILRTSLDQEDTYKKIHTSMKTGRGLKIKIHK